MSLIWAENLIKGKSKLQTTSALRVCVLGTPEPENHSKSTYLISTAISTFQSNLCWFHFLAESDPTNSWHMTWHIFTIGKGTITDNNFKESPFKKNVINVFHIFAVPHPDGFQITLRQLLNNEKKSWSSTGAYTYHTSPSCIYVKCCFFFLFNRVICYIFVDIFHKFSKLTLPKWCLYC